MRPFVVAIGSAALAGFAACAAMPRSAKPAPATQVDAGLRDPDHAEIERLSQAIAKARGDDGLLGQPLPMIAPGTALPMATVPMGSDADCHHGESDTCTSACTLSDSICTNAQKICELADKLAGDRWAADKCTDGKASCEQAHVKCCACQ